MINRTSKTEISLKHSLDTLSQLIRCEAELQRVRAEQGTFCKYEYGIYKGMFSTIQGRQTVEHDGYIYNVEGCINIDYLNDSLNPAIKMADYELNRLNEAYKLVSDDDYPYILGQLRVWDKVAATLRIWDEEN